MTKALIIGGGVAGPVAAMALQRAGIEAVLYEAYTPRSGRAHRRPGRALQQQQDPRAGRSGPPIEPCHERPWRASATHPTRSPWRRLGPLP
jgi:glycine/D-amino acid oxidase-like deaminating enzyme